MTNGDECSSGDLSFPEASRQVVHMFVGLFALLLRWLTYPQALACAVAAIVFNSLILPRLPGSRRYLYREGERESGFSMGILMYPVSVFLLILCFPIPVAASMWGVLSFGDGFATMWGARRRTRSLPWNPRKSIQGLAGFVIGAMPASVFLCWWTLPNVGSSPPWWRAGPILDHLGSLSPGAVIAVLLLAVVPCALLETLETPLDDNLTVPLFGACIMTGLVYVLGG